MKAPPSILVVEDNEAMRRLIKRYLSRHDCVISLAGTSTQALAFARKARFDVFVIDIRLNEAMTGLDLLAELRRLEGHAATPALACTVHDHAHEKQKLRGGGFNGHLGKPFTEAELWAGIQRVLGG